MFSELVDYMVQETGRRDRIALIVSATNDVLRHIHKAMDWDEDLQETLIVPAPPAAAWNAGEVVNWKHSRLMRSVRAIQLNGHCYAEFVRPGAKQENRGHYWYRSSNDTISVAGACHQIAIAWYSWNRHFQYYQPDQRPAVWDNETEAWTYLQAGAGGTSYVSTLGTAADDEAARDKVFDWPLDRLRYIVEHGVKARVFTAIGEDDRSAKFYSLFNSELRQALGHEMPVLHGFG